VEESAPGEPAAREPDVPTQVRFPQGTRIGPTEVERKALNLILESAEYDDVALDAKTGHVDSTVEAQAVPGEMHDPTAAPPAESAPEEAGST